MMEYMEISLLRTCAELHSHMKGCELKNFKRTLHDRLFFMKWDARTIGDFQVMDDNKFVWAEAHITFFTPGRYGERQTGKFLFHRYCIQIMIQEKAYLYTFDNGILREYDKTMVYLTEDKVSSRDRQIKIIGR